MKSVRIYKDDIRQHILRSLFFTDNTLFVSGGIIIAVALYISLNYIAHFFSWNIYIALLIVLEIAFIGFITQKVDNQPIYKVIPRGLMFKKSKKKYRQKELESYFIDFTIQDNLIIRKDRLVKILEVEPFDISLLNEQDREHFFMKMKQVIHILPAQIQLIVRKDTAKSADYSKHLFSLYDTSNTKRESLIADYAKDLSTLISDGNFSITRHYAVFSVPCNPMKQHEKIQAIRKLNDMAMRFASALSSCNISVRPLVNEELISFTKETLR